MIIHIVYCFYLNKRKEARELAVDQTEAMIAAIKAQLEKERAAEAAKKKREEEEELLKSGKARRKMLRLLKANTKLCPRRS